MPIMWRVSSSPSSAFFYLSCKLERRREELEKLDAERRVRQRYTSLSDRSSTDEKRTFHVSTDPSFSFGSAAQDETFAEFQSQKFLLTNSVIGIGMTCCLIIYIALRRWLLILLFVGRVEIRERSPICERPYDYIYQGRLNTDMNHP